MGEVRLVPANYRHVARIANRMRAIDISECAAMGRTPRQSLRLGLMASDKAWTALVDGLPEAMFGVVVDSALTGEVTPWFLGTDEVYRHGRELLMMGPGLVAHLCDSRRASNLVSAGNSQAIRLLKRWGFTVDEATVDMRGVPFRRFERAA
jgi:hypothetical protein